jgi:hypothetical protein
MREMSCGMGGNENNLHALMFLLYKSEGRGFYTRWGDFAYIYLILPAVLGPGVYSTSNRNEYQKHKNNNVPGE